MLDWSFLDSVLNLRSGFFFLILAPKETATGFLVRVKLVFVGIHYKLRSNPSLGSLFSRGQALRGTRAEASVTLCSAHPLQELGTNSMQPHRGDGRMRSWIGERTLSQGVTRNNEPDGYI